MDKRADLSSLIAELSASVDEHNRRLSSASSALSEKLSNIIENVSVLQTSASEKPAANQELLVALRHLRSANLAITKPKSVPPNFVWKNEDFGEVLQRLGVSPAKTGTLFATQTDAQQYRATVVAKEDPPVFGFRQLLYPEFFFPSCHWFFRLTSELPALLPVSVQFCKEVETFEVQKECLVRTLKETVLASSLFATSDQTLSTDSSTDSGFASVFAPSNLLFRFPGREEYVYSPDTHLLGHRRVYLALRRKKPLLLEAVLLDKKKTDDAYSFLDLVHKKGVAAYRGLVDPLLVLGAHTAAGESEETLGTADRLLEDLFAAEQSNTSLSERSLSFQNPPPRNTPKAASVVSLSRTRSCFALRVLCLNNFGKEFAEETRSPAAYINRLFVKFFLFFGKLSVAQSHTQTRFVAFDRETRWDESLAFPYPAALQLRQFPLELRACFLLCGLTNSNTVYYLAHATVNMFDEAGLLLAGHHRVPLVAFKDDSLVSENTFNLNYLFKATPVPTGSVAGCFLAVCFPKAAVRFRHDDKLLVDRLDTKLAGQHTETETQFSVKRFEEPLPPLSKAVRKGLAVVLDAKEPVDSLDPDLQLLVFEHRDELRYYPSMLPVFLLSVNWLVPVQREQAYQALFGWNGLSSSLGVLELLNYSFASHVLKRYLVLFLRLLSDEELVLILSQLVQSLAFESYHQSCLADFLFARALANPGFVGQRLFWLLKVAVTETGVSADKPPNKKHFRSMATHSLRTHRQGSFSATVQRFFDNDFPLRDRFVLYLERFVYHAGFATQLLYAEVVFTDSLADLANQTLHDRNVLRAPDAEVLRGLRERVEQLNSSLFVPNGFLPLPTEPSVHLALMDANKCKFMSSKQTPLLLFCSSADGTYAPLLFKHGDDLRQDALALQVFEFLDYIWRLDGLAVSLMHNRVLPTGKRCGLIEALVDAETLSDIQQKYGGGALGALKSTPLALYLKMHNKSKAAYDAAIANFISSCAGCVVATYLLGVADRHAGNIMLATDGRLYHIDFGHFLGNFKQKFGFNRERSAFVLTKDMVYLIGGAKFKNNENWNSFVLLCLEALHSCRKRGHLIICMFRMLAGIGLPELKDETDLGYLREMLCLDKDYNEAEKIFRKQMEKSISNIWRNVDNYIHNLKHGVN